MNYKVLLKRNEIGVCRGCMKSPDGIDFKGRFNEHNTHMKSECGWWLNIIHKYDIYNDLKQLPDIVGDLKCKECCDNDTKSLNELMELVI